MPAAYSYDLRKKAMEALDEGESRETVAARFKIGRTIALFTIIRTDRNMLLACYSHKHISYRIRTIIRKAILYGSGSKEEKKQETFNQKNLEMGVTITKLPTGIPLPNLPENTEERLYRKWLNFGTTLVSKRSIEPLKKLDLRAKKDIWIQGKKRRKTC